MCSMNQRETFTSPSNKKSLLVCFRLLIMGWDGENRVGPCTGPRNSTPHLKGIPRANTKAHLYLLSNSGLHARLSGRRPVWPGIGEYMKNVVIDQKGSNACSEIFQRAHTMKPIVLLQHIWKRRLEIVPTIYLDTLFEYEKRRNFLARYSSRE